MLDNENGGVNTEIRQKVFLLVSFRELHIDMLKQKLLGFPWHMMKKYLSVLVILIFDYFFRHNCEILTIAIKLFVVYTICIQAITHQELLKNWHKRRLRLGGPAHTLKFFVTLLHPYIFSWIV